MTDKIVVRIHNKEEFQKFKEWSKSKGYKQPTLSDSYYLNYHHHDGRPFELCVWNDPKEFQFDTKLFYETKWYRIISLEEAMREETEVEFVRGEEVEVSDGEWRPRHKRIYIATIEGAESPYITVQLIDEGLFRTGLEFSCYFFKHIRKLQPTGEVKKFTKDNITDFLNDYVKNEIMSNDAWLQWLKEAIQAFLKKHNLLEEYS